MVPFSQEVMGLHSFNKARALAAERLAQEQAAAKPLPVEIEELPEVTPKRSYKRKAPVEAPQPIEDVAVDEPIAE